MKKTTICFLVFIFCGIITTASEQCYDIRLHNGTIISGVRYKTVNYEGSKWLEYWYQNDPSDPRRLWLPDVDKVRKAQCKAKPTATPHITLKHSIRPEQDHGSTPPTVPPKYRYDRTVRARQLLQEYEENEIAADQKYDGKFIRVSGAIKDISKNWGDPVIKIGYHNYSSITCYMEKSEENKVARLRKDQVVTVIGRCGGSGFFGNTVLLFECVLL